MSEVALLSCRQPTSEILFDVEITIKPEEILRAQRVRSRPALLEALDKVIAMGADLWQPRAVYAWWPVQKVKGETLYLADGLSLTIGFHADLLAQAREVLVGVRTIGPALEERVQELMKTNPLLGYMLDSVGVEALGQIGQVLHRLAEERAAERGWGVSPSLAPGSLVGWPMTGQRELFRLVDPSLIGVYLSEQCVMRPHKSVSQLIGLGPGYDEQVGSVCRFCSLQERCWRRYRG
ncbi:MAG: hypothetical protein SVX38_05675 [Chloroflexota bacterium]|nr:hypothetical protein [Chloroflexota bacterium]